MSDQGPRDLQVSSPELKFLLGLLTFPGYRAPIAQIRPSAKTSATERDRLCKKLHKKGLIEYEETITRLGLTAAGRTLINLDASVLPITPDERLILKSCQDGSIAPEQIHARVPKSQRQRLILGLSQRGCLKITQRQIETVWITAAGQTFLRDECAPEGNTPVLSWSQMSSYLQFMRQSQPLLASPEIAPETAVTPDDLFQMITHLDTVLRTENYLPIYHLREKLQPPLSRQELDQYLYQLQRDDRIDFSTLQDVSRYRKEEIAAGIPQDIGGPLFFISVV